MQILDGKNTAQKINDSIREQILKDLESLGRPPRIDMILVGDEYGSAKYVSMKEKRASELGFDGVVHRLEKSSKTKDVKNKVQELNLFSAVDGFMIQLPMPDHIDEVSVLEQIDPRKDVDGLTSVNLGKLFQKDPSAIASATPKGIMLLMENYGIELEGLNAVVVGRSKIVGLPMAALLNEANCTVTIAHSRTRDLKSICKRADILVSAVGMPNFITTDFIKPGAIVIDVGINKATEGNIPVGDVDYLKVAPMTSYITPVPGGVGPMTISALMWNTLHVWKSRSYEK